MKIDRSENLIRRYLLGQLPEAEQTALEETLLLDRGKFDQVWAVENAMVDSYVRGKMSRADRERFEGHYLASSLHRERVAIAELFLKDTDETIDETVEVRERELAIPWLRSFLPRWAQPSLGAALVMAIFLTLGAVWLFIERTRLTEQVAKVQNDAQTERASLKRREEELALRKQELEKEIADERRRSGQLKTELEQLRRARQSILPAFLSFLLTPAPMRDKNGPPPPTIPFVKSGMRLLMELAGSDYSGYQIRLQTVEGREILNKTATRLGKDWAFATITLPAGTLAKGDYILVLSGRTARGEQEEIDQYFFRVQ
jgi:hypothetical protein